MLPLVCVLKALVSKIRIQWYQHLRWAAVFGTYYDSLSRCIKEGLSDQNNTAERCYFVRDLIVKGTEVPVRAFPPQSWGTFWGKPAATP